MPPYDRAEDPTLEEPRSAPEATLRPTPTPDATFGRYVLIDKLGTGGMGTVFRAYDPKLGREVALKRLRSHCDAHNLEARLVREARAMAKLSHPNVVEVYDVEFEAGEVVLAMEYIPGSTLAGWLEGEDRHWRTIVDVFVQAGRGLAAAHARGLLHRDFKPANVLVMERPSGRSASTFVAKVTDFGLAHWPEARRSHEASVHQTDASGPASGAQGDSDRLTREGFAAGTPRYMAPEQHRASELSPAADQYAFCVALWEALTGGVLFSGDALIAAKHRGPPSWPDGNAVPAGIAQALARGLTPAVSRRWPSMEALLSQLTADSRRHRTQWVAGAVVTAMVTVAGVAWGGRDHSKQQRCTGAQEQIADVWNDQRRAAIEAALTGTDVRYAADVAAHAAVNLDAYAMQWADAHTDACQATTIEGRQPESVMDERIACLHRAKTGLEAAVSVLEEADASVVPRVPLILAGLPSVARCGDLETLHDDISPPPATETEIVTAIRAMVTRAGTLRRAGRFGDALRVAEEAHAATAGVVYRPVVAETLVELGMSQDTAAKYEESRTTLVEGLRTGLQEGHLQAAVQAAARLVYVTGIRLARQREALVAAVVARGLVDHLGTVHWDVTLRNNLAALYGELGRYEDAVAQSRAALALRRREPSPTGEATLRTSLGSALDGLGKYDEAVAEHRIALKLREAALGSRHPHTALSHGNLGSALEAAGRYEESEAEHRLALETRIEVLGPDHPKVATSRSNLGSVLQEQGEYEEALGHFEIALEIFMSTFGPEHPAVATLHHNLGVILNDLGRHDEAVAQHRQALAVWRQVLGEQHPNIALSLNSLGNALKDGGKIEGAADQYRASLELSQRVFGPRDERVGRVHYNLGRVHTRLGDVAGGEQHHRTALTIMRAAHGPGHPALATAAFGLGLHLLEHGDVDEARELLEQAWTVHQRSDIDPAQRAATAFELARALWSLAGQRTRARQLARDAERSLVTHERGRADLLPTVRRWLAAHSR